MPGAGDAPGLPPAGGIRKKRRSRISGTASLCVCMTTPQDRPHSASHPAGFRTSQERPRRVRRPQAAKQFRSVFSGGVYVGENTAQAANVRAQRVRCGGLLAPSKKCGHFFEVLHDEPPVRRDDLPGEEGGLLGGQERHGGGDVLRRAQAAQRRLLRQVPAGLLRQH